MASIPASCKGLRTISDVDTQSFLSSVVPKMDWSRQDEDVVMDVGCGTGTSLRNQFLTSYPNVRKIVAIDVMPVMIEFAKAHNAHPKIEYYQANIENSSTLQRWMGQMTKITSVNCINCLKRQRNGFQNIYDLLKPGGEAALLFVTKFPTWSSYCIYIDSPKWNKYLKDVQVDIPETHAMPDSSSYFKGILQDVGFITASFEEVERSFAFGDDATCKMSLTSICPLLEYIPNELKDEFMGEFVETFLKFNSRNSEGKPMMLYTTLTLLLRKPE